jgi:hypothetical protein
MLFLDPLVFCFWCRPCTLKSRVRVEVFSDPRGDKAPNKQAALKLTIGVEGAADDVKKILFFCFSFRWTANGSARCWGAPLGRMRVWGGFPRRCHGLREACPVGADPCGDPNRWWALPVSPCRCGRSRAGARVWPTECIFTWCRRSMWLGRSGRTEGAFPSSAHGNAVGI